MYTWLTILTLVLIVMITGLISAQGTTGVRELEIDLGADFTTQAVLTFPSEGDGPFPTLILFHGSGPYDMDATRMNPSGNVSTNFRRLAEELGEAGIAVLRFNKRGVLNDGMVDQAQVQSSTLDRLVLDAVAVIDTARELPEVDTDQLYLYGWSEGAWVAVNAAAEKPDWIAGLILQGAPNGDLSTILPYQYLENGIPFLATEIDANGDGQLSPDEIQTIPNGYPVSLMPSFFMWAYDSTPGEPRLNPMTDANQDGLIDLESELRPTVEAFINQFPMFLSGIEASYATADVVATLNVPVLIVHGESDGWVPVTSGDAIASAAPAYTMLKTYEGLGHALSPVASPVEDTFEDMSAEPIADIADWMLHDAPVMRTQSTIDPEVTPDTLIETEQEMPYTSENVTFENENVTLAGTLTLPNTPGPHPAVVLISGSGPQNRDSSMEPVASFAPFAVIADHLSRHGIAVLRYDDRGVAASTGDFASATSYDFAADAVAALNFLKKRPDIQSDHIGIIGHSEGGMIAPMVANEADASFVVLMAGSTVPGVEVMLQQGRRTYEALGYNDIDLIVEKSRALFAALTTEDATAENVTPLLQELLAAQVNAMPELQRTSLGDPDMFIQAATPQLVANYLSPWFRTFLSFNPQADIEQLTVPVLALYGKLDTQVDAQQNASVLEALMVYRDVDYQIVSFPDANHLFQSAQTGSTDEYSRLTPAFTPDFLPTLTDWLQQQSQAN